MERRTATGNDIGRIGGARRHAPRGVMGGVMRVVMGLAVGLAMGLAVLVVAAMMPAHAAACLAREDIGERLADDHGERLRAAGLASNGELLEVFASPGGTWTLVLTDASGRSCVVASGEGWSPEPAATDATDS